MKNPRIQTKNPEIQAKNPKVWILTCESYLEKDCQKSIQESNKNPKLKNFSRRKSSQSIVTEGIPQESKNPKSIRKFSQILESAKPIAVCLHRPFPRIQPHPPPLHGGYEIPSMDGMEVPFLRLTNLNFYQQQKNKNYEQ